jgi:hypothetical protein
MDIDILKIISLLIGILFVYLSFLFLVRCHKLKSWFPVELLDLETEIKQEKELAQHTNLLFRYIPYAKYKYVVDGVEYYNSSVSIDKNREWSYYKDKTGYFLKLIEKSEVAYVNPKDHSEAVLLKDAVKRSKSHHISLFIVGLLLLGVGIII